MLQVPCLPISPVANDGELETMTLIVAIQTQDSIIMAADGMAYVQEPSDTANIPYEKIKIHRANSSWIIAFSGWAGIEVGHVGLEAEIERGTKSFDSDISIGGPPYIEALRATYSTSPKTRVTLAGFSRGLPRILNVDFPGGSVYFADKISANGAQKTAAQWILNMFSGCCTSILDFKELALFTIWQVAHQELTVGQIERGYRLSVCVLKAGQPPKIEQLDTQLTLARMNRWLETIQRACSSFLSSTAL